jgi:hypothetical protein
MPDGEACTAEIANGSRLIGCGHIDETITHFALDFPRKESVCGGDGHRARRARPLDTPPAPDGLRGVSVVARDCASSGAMPRRYTNEARGVSYVQAQACASPSSAVGFESQI